MESVYRTNLFVSWSELEHLVATCQKVVKNVACYRLSLIVTNFCLLQIVYCYKSLASHYICQLFDSIVIIQSTNGYMHQLAKKNLGTDI